MDHHFDEIESEPSNLGTSSMFTSDGDEASSITRQGVVCVLCSQTCLTVGAGGGGSLLDDEG